MTEILYGLHGERRERVAALRKRGDFFWLDASLSETGLDDLVDALDIPERASQALVGYGEAHDPSRKFHADGQHVVFVSTCYLEPAKGARESPQRLRPVEVHVLVSGEYLLTLHQERMSLPELLAPDVPEGRSEKYVVYSVLDSMVATSFDALNEFDLMLDDVAIKSTEMRGSRVQMATLRGMISGLGGMRRRAGSQRGLSERIGMEIERLPGLQADEERYFDRLGDQVNRLVDAIYAAGDDMATVIDLDDRSDRHAPCILVAGSGLVPSGGAAGVAPDRRARIAGRRGLGSRGRRPRLPRDLESPLEQVPRQPLTPRRSTAPAG